MMGGLTPTPDFPISVTIPSVMKTSCGFTNGRVTKGGVFTVKQLNEECCEQARQQCAKSAKPAERCEASIEWYPPKMP